MENKIELLRLKLTKEVSAFKEAIANGTTLDEAKALYLQAKKTFEELRKLTNEYEGQINTAMENFIKNNS